jgi:hypothetical protein
MRIITAIKEYLFPKPVVQEEPKLAKPVKKVATKTAATKKAPAKKKLAKKETNKIMVNIMTIIHTHMLG